MIVRKLQRGTIELVVLCVAAVAALAAVGGIWTYYSTQNAKLKEDVRSKDVIIDTLTKEKAELGASVAGLKIANESWLGQVNQCKSGLAEVQKERNARDLEAKAAKADAQRQSLIHKKTIADILNANAGIDWCRTWDKMVTDYTVMRQQRRTP